MSRRPIARSHDLLRLQNEGYDLEIRGALLLVRGVPYVTANRTVALGTLISKLNLSADKTANVDDHVAHWMGEHPCHADGSKILSFKNDSAPQDLGNGVRTDFTFSAKAAYRDYHHKITTYIGRIAGEATKIDATADARKFRPILNDEENSVFKYVDTATSRAGIGAVNCKLAGKKVGIAGMGGTGAYLLDLLAKTELAEIHIVDGDVFSQHNAFRAPGAPSFEALDARPQKVNYFAASYGNMRNGIIAHDTYIVESNLDLFDGLDFVFICIDRGEIKRTLVARLIANRTSFIDVGMGVVLDDTKLSGIVRTTLSTPETREQAAPHISYAEGDAGVNEYSSNIQIPELNALNAIKAVIRFKKFFGLLADTRNNVNEGYSIPSGEIVGEDS